MVSSKQAGNPASYQRSINQGIRKVIGSSNRGFASMDPERQRGIDIQESGNTVRPSGNAHELSSQQDREAPRKGENKSGSGGSGGAAPAGGAAAERGKTTDK